MVSTARLIEKTNRFGPSSGSQGSLTPVSPHPVRATAAASATAEWRIIATCLKKPSTIDPEAPRKRLGLAVVAASVAHAAFTLKAARDSCFSLADINIFLYVFLSWIVC